MKRIAIATALLLVSSAGCAQADVPNVDVPTVYVEIGFGASFIPTVQTKNFTIPLFGGLETGHADLNYSTALTESAEIGLAGVAVPEIRLAASYEHLTAHFDNGSITGTLNSGPGIPSATGTLSATRAELNSLGFDAGLLDSDVSIATANVYYSLPLLDFAKPVILRPYLGMGLGAAWLTHADTQLAVTATAGVRVSLSEDAYLGLRYRYYRITGPTDALGIQLDPINNHSIMAVIGYYVP
jgi:opacity protein-like surface antigen